MGENVFVALVNEDNNRQKTCVNKGQYWTNKRKYDYNWRSFKRLHNAKDATEIASFKIYLKGMTIAWCVCHEISCTFLFANAYTLRR